MRAFILFLIHPILCHYHDKMIHIPYHKNINLHINKTTWLSWLYYILTLTKQLIRRRNFILLYPINLNESLCDIWITEHSPEFNSQTSTLYGQQSRRCIL